MNAVHLILPRVCAVYRAAEGYGFAHPDKERFLFSSHLFQTLMMPLLLIPLLRPLLSLFRSISRSQSLSAYELSRLSNLFLFSPVLDVLCRPLRKPDPVDRLCSTRTLTSFRPEVREPMESFLISDRTATSYGKFSQPPSTIHWSIATDQDSSLIVSFRSGPTWPRG